VEDHIQGSQKDRRKARSSIQIEDEELDASKPA